MTKDPAEIKDIYLQPSHIKVYTFIDKYLKKNLFAPEVNEIATATKFSLKHAYRIVEELYGFGYISKIAYRKRSIRIIKPLTE